MDIDWQPVFTELVKALAALVLVVLAWLGKWLRDYIAEKVGSIKDGRVRIVVQNLILAAEQQYGPKAAEAKLEYVMAGIERLGLSVTRDEVEALVYLLTPTQANGAATGASPFPTPEDIHEIAGVGD